jgi:UDP-N-acetylglucosamine/UDP-N-acetylgalactosamine diphosphorylase
LHADYSTQSGHGYSASLGELRERFASFGQEHVFRFWDVLGSAGRARLAAQAAALDLGALAAADRATRELAAPGARCLEPAPIQRLPEHGGDAKLAAAARECGEEMLAAGRVAALVVAGGQGTRLGFEGPKGAFPLGPLTDRTLFEQQAQKIQGLRHRYGRPMPWYIMTSAATDTQTRALFHSHAFFGLPEGDVYFFQQGMIPAFDFEGRLILDQPDHIFESPNGHGGSLTGLVASGALDDMERRGVSSIYYYQVDNPLGRIGDPVYLGFHAAAGADMSCKVIAKLDPLEKMGVVARIDGRIGVVEYTELDDEHRYARGSDGELVYWAGNIAIHVIEAAFARRAAANADRILPYHASAKKIPTIDDNGHPVAPSEPNGRKLERFVFDALTGARWVTVLETRRDEEYSPIKNASGADSPQTARRDLMAVYRRWLSDAGVEGLDVTAPIEVNHAVFDGPDDLRARRIRRVAEAGDAIRIAPGVAE